MFQFQHKKLVINKIYLSYSFPFYLTVLFIALKFMCVIAVSFALHFCTATAKATHMLTTRKRACLSVSSCVFAPKELAHALQQFIV